MNTLKLLKEKTSSLQSIYCLLVVILFYGCNKDEDPIDTTPTLFGTYSLTSISSNVQLDPMVSGQFNDDELIDNISCDSSITLNDDNSFSWDFLRVNQNSTTVLGVIGFYAPIQCAIISDTIGEFEVNGALLSLNPVSRSNTTASINENAIEIIITEELIINEGSGLEKERVNLILTYER